MSRVGLWKYLKNFEKHSTSYKLTEWLLRLVKLISEMSLPQRSKTKLKLSATKKALKTAQPHLFSNFHFNDLGRKTVLLLWSLAHLSQFHCQDRSFGFQSSFCKKYLYLLSGASHFSLSQYLLWSSQLALKLILTQKILIEALISLCKVLILIPIFGVHFLLLPIRPAEGSSLEYTYEVNNHHQKSLTFSLWFSLSM